MGNGHRPGHRRGGREGKPSRSRAERVLVLPGEEIRAEGLDPGPGTYRVSGRTFASILGLLDRRPPVVQVIPLSGRYIPRAGDTVVGTVTDVQGTFWLLDIGAPRWAPLHMTGTPWKIDFGETGQYLHVADAVVVQVESIENTGRIGVTMNGDGLGKLEGGTIVTVSPAKVPRVIGRGGSMINTITQLTGCRMVVGQNGRVWVDGPDDGMLRARECLRLIDEEGHRSGLTERIHAYLAESADPANPPPRPSSRSPDHERPHRDSEAPPHHRSPPAPPLAPPDDAEPVDGIDDVPPGF